MSRTNEPSRVLFHTSNAPTAVPIRDKIISAQKNLQELEASRRELENIIRSKMQDPDDFQSPGHYVEWQKKMRSQTERLLNRIQAVRNALRLLKKMEAPS